MKLGLTWLSCAVFYTVIQDFLYGVNAVINNDDLTLNSTDTLEINTTAPSVSCSPSCNYNASHESRNSSNVTYLVAVIKFTGDIVFNNGSIVKVFGDYALSMTSLNGSIDIQTDINMTCGETRLNTTCLGGFTQSAKGVLVGPPGTRTRVYRGLGPGGLLITGNGLVPGQCVSGSSHGGAGFRGRHIFKAGSPYDTDNVKSLLGGSGDIRAKERLFEVY